ncbi:MAG: PorV/PorQ family protein [Candidatus Marinimicrobia bacterium]|nr:PorV/PorQ family protein [Candidatus Neomarinimicrobiota bacterium]
MIKKSILAWIMFSLISFQSFAFEKVGVTSFQFLKISMDPTSAAMGGAFAAVSRGTESMYNNPAALVKQRGFGTFLSQLDYVFDANHSTGAASWGFGDWAIGVYGISVDYGSIQVTDIDHLFYADNGSFNPGLTGEKLSLGATDIGIGFSQELTNKFSYGIISKYIREDFSIMSSSLVAWDIGVLYDSGFRSIVLGATLRNFGPQVKYITQSYPLPQTMNLGVSAELLGAGTPLFKESDSHTLLISADLLQPRDYGQQYNIGAEYAFRDLLFVRSGYRLNYDTEGLNIGLGFKLKSVALNYSYSDYGEQLPGVHRVSIGFINI